MFKVYYIHAFEFTCNHIPRPSHDHIVREITALKLAKFDHRLIPVISLNFLSNSMPQIFSPKSTPVINEGQV